MAKKYNLYHGYCTFCKEETGGRFSDSDLDKEIIYCNQCATAMPVDEALLKELQEEALEDERS